LRRQLTETTEAKAGPILALNCCHHWIIEAAIDASSRGVCRLCGEEKLFRNQLQWAEIVPPRAVNSRRQANDITITPDQGEAPAFVLAGSRYGSSRPLESAGRGH
jgi:hypothetical protein